MSATLGPGDGSITVHTFREGVAQKVGHDLVIAATAWRADVETAPDGAVTAVALEVDPRGLEVREGLHGLKPLTDKDRQDIRGNIEGKILGTTPITFRSTSVTAADGGYEIAGDLTLAGQTRPERFALGRSADGRLTGRLTVTQTAFGVKPYRGLMGALKVRDDVEIAVDVALPA